MFTEYSKVLNFFKVQARMYPSTDLRDIWFKFVEIKYEEPNDVGAARYLINQYHSYIQVLKEANVHVS